MTEQEFDSRVRQMEGKMYRMARSMLRSGCVRSSGESDHPLEMTEKKHARRKPGFA